jgi:hypothetical protein
MSQRSWIFMIVPLGVLLATGANAQQKSDAVAKSKQHAAERSVVPAYRTGLEPRAIEILKAASAKLAAAQSMSFTAVASYEGPSLLGPPLIYSTKSEVTLKRPDKLKVITVGDGPPSEFYDDGKLMMAYAPNENLVAVADAPSSIDAALRVIYDSAATYFPFSDVIVTDPYTDLADGMTTAFYIGQSVTVGDTVTDMVAFVSGNVFSQAWIGAEDRLPRRLYAVYLDDPARLRHVLELSHWQLDTPVTVDAFGSAKAAAATRVAFKRPDADAPSPPKAKAAAQPASTR